jgi:hypothetical protein
MRFADPRFLGTKSVVLRCQSLYLCLRHVLNILLLALLSMHHVTATSSLHMLTTMFKDRSGRRIWQVILISAESSHFPILPDLFQRSTREDI